MIIDGRRIAEEIYLDLKPKFERVGRAPRLGIIVCGVNSVIESFVHIKTRAAERLGITIARIDFGETRSQSEIIEAVKKLAQETDALIVQLPLPQKIDTDVVLSAIPREKDVDAINPALSDDQRLVQAPVALAVVEILKRSGIESAGKRVVVVGNGRLVGAPSASLLKRLGARVSIFSLQEGAIEDLKAADIVVLGAGKPGFIKPEHLKKGVVLLDGGASEQGGKVVGDADPACAKVASVFTPVPGGLGPVAVAMIFKNLLDLVQKSH